MDQQVLLYDQLNILMKNLWEFKDWVDLDIENSHYEIEHDLELHSKHQI
jgi:hypothetical protein